MLHKSDQDRSGHMIDAVRLGLEYADGRTVSDIQDDVPVQHLFIRSLEILGEAASRVSPELRAEHPEIPWRLMIGSRNRLIHGYFDIEIKLVWTTIVEEFPSTLEKLLRIQAKLK